MFKSYTTNDNLLLPPSLGELIPDSDPVRVVDRIIEQIDLTSLYRKYSRLGSHAYHPRLMLKLLIYAYLRNVYSSRRIENLCRNDIRFLWLNGMDVPDHNTINRFRSGRLKGLLKEVFSTIVKFLVAEGLVSLDRVYTDGTKIESVANRYTFIKYNYFHKEQTKKWRTDPFRSSNFYYNSTQDSFYCPMGQPMRFIGKRKQHTKTGFEQDIHIYQAIRCQGCPLRSLCHKSKINRRIEVNHRLNKLKAEEKEKLLSPQGLVHRSQKPQEVEATFGNLKNNKNFKRFLCKGKNKVELEFGLLAIAHNIAKVAS